MPVTIPRPPSSHNSGQKRPAEQRRLPFDGTRIRSSIPPLLDPIADSRSTSAPKILHFIVIGELLPIQLDYIRAWGTANPEYKVKVWHDSNAMAAGALARFVTDRVYDDLGSMISEMPTDRLTNHAEYLRELAFEEIKQKLQTGKSWSVAVREYLTSQGEPVRVEALTTLEKLQIALYQGLDATIDQQDIASLPGIGEWRESYDRALYRYGNAQEAYHLALLNIGYHEGGVFPDIRTLPEVAEHVFAGVTFPNLPAEQAKWSEYARVQAILDHQSEFSGEHSARATTGVEAGYTDYLTLLRESPVAGARETAELITTTVVQRSGYFTDLKTLTLDEQIGVRLGSGNVLGHDKPLFLISRKGAAGLLSVEGIIRENYYNIEQFEGIYRQFLPQFQTRNPQAQIQARKAEELFIKNKAKPKYKTAAFDPSSDREFRHYFDSITSYRRGSVYAGTDPSGEISGFRAFQRGIGKAAKPDGTQRIRFDNKRFGFNDYTYATEEMEARGASRFYKPQKYVKIRKHDKLVILQIDSDRVITEGAAALFGKSGAGDSVADRYWVKNTNPEEALEYVAGRAFLIDENTKIVVTAHGSLRGMGGLPSSEVAGIIVKLIPEDIRPRLVFASCATEDARYHRNLPADGKIVTDINDAQTHSFASAVVADLASVHNRKVQSVSARSQSIFLTADGRKLVQVMGEGTFAIVNKPDTGVLIVTPNYNEDGSVESFKFVPKYAPEGGASVSRARRFHLGLFASNALSSTEVYDNPVESRDAILDMGLSLADSQMFQSRVSVLSADLTVGSVLLPADLTALLLGMQESDSNHVIVVVDSSTLKVAGVMAALDLMGESGSVTEWLAKITEHFPETLFALQVGLAQVLDKDLAFSRLKAKADSGRFAFYVADPMTEDGAAFINEHVTEGFASIHQPELADDASLSIDEKISSLTLLADDETRLLIGNNADDIALHDNTGNVTLKKAQKRIYEFRRAMSTQRVAEHEGYHTYIAMTGDKDDPAFMAVKALVEKEDSKGRALLYDKDHDVLLTEDGRVVVTVEGGPANRVSLVGDVTTLAGLDNPALASLVEDVCHSSSVGSLELLALGGDNDSVTRLAEGMAGQSREVLDRVVDLSGARTLMSTGDTYTRGSLLVRPAGEEQVFRMPVLTGDALDGLDVPNLKQQLESDALPHKKLDELRAKAEALPEELRQMDQATGRQFVNRVHEFTQKAVEFNQVLQRVYNEKGLTSDWTPRLDSLVKQGKAWEMDFYNTKTGQWQHIEDIQEPGIERFRLFYEDKLRSVKRVLTANEHANPEALHGEFVDGAGWAFAMQGFIAMLERHDVAEKMDGMNPVLRNVMEAHAYVNLLFLARVGTNFILDATKYALALHTGEIRSLPERIAGRMMAVSEEVGGAVGKSISLAAKSIQFAGAVFDIALGLASIGLDIAELVKADDSTLKALAATQLGVDSVSAIIGIAGLVAGLAGAASLSIVFSGVGVIFAGLAVGVTALVATTIKNIKKFEQVIKLFDQVAMAVDLDVVDHSFKALNFATLYDDGHHALRWAPISEINFEDNTVTFGKLLLTKVYGGWGRSSPGTFYYLSGPVNHSGETFDSIQKVRGSKKARLPDTDYDLVMLPLLSKWEVTGWRHQVIAGAVTRWNHRKGVKFLSAAEGKDFAFNWVLMALFPWLDLEYGLHEITGTKVHGTHVTIRLDNRSRTLFSMAPPRDLKKLQTSYTYDIYSSGSATYSLVMQKGVTYNIYPSGQDHWNLVTYDGSSCDCLPVSNGDCSLKGLTLQLKDVTAHFKDKLPKLITVDDHHGEYTIESNGDIGVLDIQIMLHGTAHERQEELNRLLAGAKHERFLPLNAKVSNKDCCAKPCNTGGGFTRYLCKKEIKQCHKTVKGYEALVKNWDDTEAGKIISVTLPWAYYLNQEPVQPISVAPKQGYYYYAANAQKIYFENKYRRAEKFCLNKNDKGEYTSHYRTLSSDAPVTVHEIKGITSDESKQLIVLSPNGVQYKLGWSGSSWSVVPLSIHTDHYHLVAALGEAHQFGKTSGHVLSLTVVNSITGTSPTPRRAGFFDPKANLAVYFSSIDYDFDENCPRREPRLSYFFPRVHSCHSITRKRFNSWIPIYTIKHYCYKVTKNVHHNMMTTHGAVHSIVRGKDHYYILLRPGSGRFFVYHWHGHASNDPVQVTSPVLREVFFYPDGTEPFFIHAMKTNGQLLGYTNKGQVLAIGDDNFVALQDRTGLSNYLFDDIGSFFRGLCGYSSLTPKVIIISATPATVSLTLVGFDLDALYSAFDLTRGNRHHPQQYQHHITSTHGRKPAKAMLTMTAGEFVPYSEKRLSALFNATPFNWTSGTPEALMLLPRVGQVAVERHHVNYTLPDGGSYYIPSLFRIIADSCLRFLGLFGSERVVAANEHDQIVFYDFSNSSHSNHTLASCLSQNTSRDLPLNPELVKTLPPAYIFNPQQLPLTKICWEGSFALGTDNKGYVYRITQTTQSLVGLQVFTRQQPSKHGYALPVSVSRGMLSASSIAQLEPEVVRVCQYMLDNRNSNLLVLFSEQLPMIVHLPGDLDENYQTWYEADKQRAVFYDRKAGNDSAVRLLGSGINSDENNETVGYFFAEKSGYLYRDGASGQSALGRYGNVIISGNMQVFLGTQGNDTLDAGSLLYIDPPRMMNAQLNQTNTTDNSSADLSSYWVYLEGLAGFDEYRVSPEALHKYRVVYIHPSELAQQGQDDTGVKTIDLTGYSAGEFTGYFYGNDAVLEHSKTGHRVIIENLFLLTDSIEAMSGIKVRFSDGELTDLMAQMLVNEGQLAFPLKVSALTSDKTELKLKGRQWFIDARDLPAPYTLYDNDDLLLVFIQRQNFSQSVENPLDRKRDRTYYRRKHTQTTTRSPDQENTTEIRLSLKNYRYDEYAQGSVWFAGTNRTRYDLFQYDDTPFCQDCLNGKQFNILITDEPGFSSLPDFQNETLWVNNQCHSLDDRHCAVLVQAINQTDYPLFPLYWLNTANASLPERYPWSVRTLSEQGAASGINVVMYGVSPGDVSFRFSEAGGNAYQWLATVNGWPMRSGVVQKTPTTSFELSLPASGRFIQRYKVVPFAADSSEVKTHNSQWQWQGHEHYLPLELDIQTLPAGFRPEREIARYMLLESLPVCDGVYFTDGLKDRLQLFDFLATQPLTIVETNSQGSHNWSATGNALNNIVPVQLRQFGHYTVNSGAGDDLILVNGEIWASRLSFPVTWSTHANATRRDTIKRNVVKLTVKAKEAPVATPPPPTGYEVDIHPGSGDDIIDINEAANVRIQESDGQDAVIVQHFAFADLKALRNGVLFLKDIYSTEVQPVLFNSTTGETVGTLAEATEIFLWSSRFDPGRYIARLDAQSVTEIHFANGKQVTNVAQWYEHQSGVEAYDSGDLASGSAEAGYAEAGYGSGEFDTEKPGTTVDVVENKLDSASIYALVSKDEPITESSAALNGLDLTVARLIQEMSRFKNDLSEGVFSTIKPSATSPQTQTLAMPANTYSLINPTPTPMG